MNVLSVDAERRMQAGVCGFIVWIFEIDDVWPRYAFRYQPIPAVRICGQPDALTGVEDTANCEHLAIKLQPLGDCIADRDYRERISFRRVCDDNEQRRQRPDPGWLHSLHFLFIKAVFAWLAAMPSTPAGALGPSGVIAEVPAPKRYQ